MDGTMVSGRMAISWTRRWRMFCSQWGHPVRSPRGQPMEVWTGTYTG